MREPGALGAKIRALRRREKMTQAALAGRLGISPSYLNLIEHNRRALSAPLLIKLAQLFAIDVRTLSAEHDARLAADLLEVFGDPLFESHAPQASDVRELAATYPGLGRALIALYNAYQGGREALEALATRLSGDDAPELDGSRLPSEEVSDFIQANGNHFPELEAGGERLWRDAQLASDSLYEQLQRYLEEVHGVLVRVETVGAMRGAVRRYDPTQRRLLLSEVLRRGSRNFQLAHQIGQLSEREAIERSLSSPVLSSDAARALARVGLANYFAGAVLMPYRPFLEAARAERYDIDVLGNRFRTSYEQVCHRLTTLRRAGAEGVPFHFVRIDVAGNISKRFSASGLRFPRFSGACPRWNVFAAFLTPAMMRVQVSQMPDGERFFWVARTVRKDQGGYHAPHTRFAIGLGCDVRHAGELIYADGVDLESKSAVVPVGVTCRLCPRLDCEQRAFPAVQHPLQIDENVRGVSFYAPAGPSGP
jgi:XRE family transcriptional regulator, fatty acid utilization regulator